MRRGDGRTIVAGYPWFTDWGRDTFIALRGLCLATGRLDEAGAILAEWAGAVSEGMLPNLFPDAASRTRVQLRRRVALVSDRRARVPGGERGRGRAASTGEPPEALQDAFGAILTGYARGTRYGIRADADGLLAAGEPGVQLTWMDAKVGDWVVTPRIGKPVEIQALWINALRIARASRTRSRDLLAKATASFERRFWNEEAGCLYDVVDVDHRRGRRSTARCGRTRSSPSAACRSRSSRASARGASWTPSRRSSRRRSACGRCRPTTRATSGRYEGGVRERDGAYHQGTVWPFLAGAFVDAWVRVRGGGDDVKREARERFLAPLIAHLDEAGLGHVSEIADGDAPHTPRGCPFQAWSLGELIRLDRVVLAPERDGRARRHPRPERLEGARMTGIPSIPSASGSTRTASARRTGSAGVPTSRERQWGTVREDYSPHGTAWDYFPHDHARSRAYRWGEDGLMGLSDRHQYVCFALALWNGKDPILKERLFGLTGPQGNHGEDVKECYYYLDSTPTHSYMKALYKYPQREFPYQSLLDENRRRSRTDPEFELARHRRLRRRPLLRRLHRVREGDAGRRPDPHAACSTADRRRRPLHLLPTIWFRNTWSWGRGTRRQRLREGEARHGRRSIERGQRVLRQARAGLRG